MCFPSLCPALRKGNGNKPSFQFMLIAPAVFLRQGFFCPKPDIGNKIHSRTCREKATLAGKLRRVSCATASRAGLALPLCFQNSRRLLPPFTVNDWLSSLSDTAWQEKRLFFKNCIK